MKRVLILFFSIIASLSFAQDHQVLLQIDTMPVYTDEFVYIYQKNNHGKDSMSVRDYLKLFVNYKLKVYQALQQGYNKDSAFLSEYHKYIVQAAEPYFYSKTKQEQLLRDFYNKMHKEVRFSYIAKIIPEKDGKLDTAAVYKQMLAIRKQALAGTDFKDLVKKYSDSKRKNIDDGDAGFTTVYGIPYRFIGFLWNSKIGAISEPIRYRRVYYILKKTGERPYSGEVHVAQIYVALPKNAPAHDSVLAYLRVKAIDSMLKAGIPWDSVAAKFSDDYRSASRGGDIGWIRAGQTIPSFEKAAFSLKRVGQITRVRTPLGIHFIKLLGRRNLGTYEQEHERLLKQLKASGADRLVEEYVMDSLKKVYGFKMLGSLDKFYNNVTKDIFYGKWGDTVLVKDNTPLFEIGGQVYTNADFAKFLLHNQHATLERDMTAYINSKFEKFVDSKVKLLYALDLAKKQNTDFGHLAKEFYEGLLLYNISNDKVWAKAAKDSVGLIKFYKRHRHNYDTLAYISVYKGDKQAIEKALKQLRKFRNKQLDSNLVKAVGDTSLSFVGSYLVSKSDTAYGFIFKKKNRKHYLVVGAKEGKEKLIVFNPKFNHIKGIVIADYQDYLDKQWIKHLHKEYKVKINYQVLAQIEQNLKKIQEQ